jgi:cardiolipin synthase
VVLTWWFRPVLGFRLSSRQRKSREEVSCHHEPAASCVPSARTCCATVCSIPHRRRNCEATNRLRRAWRARAGHAGVFLLLDRCEKNASECPRRPCDRVPARLARRVLTRMQRRPFGGPHVTRSGLLSIPNLLTLLRVPLALGFVWVAPDTLGMLVILLLAWLSDIADGWSARRLGMASGNGAALDPIIDKLFAAAVCLTLLHHARLGLVVLLLLSTRELVELPLACWLMLSPRARRVRLTRMEANWVGKLATGLQFASLTLLLLGADYWEALILTAVIGAFAAFSYWQRFLGSVAIERAQPGPHPMNARRPPGGVSTCR